MDAHLEILIQTPDSTQREILIAELSDLGFEGFEEEDSTLHAFVKEEDFREGQFGELIQKYGLDHERKWLPEQNWNESWEKNFDPVNVGNFCFIRSGFHKPDHHALFDIIITPKMSFGTGHHATTFMMIEGMEQLSLNGKKVLDFGTGTGILAILAEKMGAEQVLAIDSDDWSIANARENISENGCSKIQLDQSSTLPGGFAYDLVLANINKNVIFKSLHKIKQQLNKDGVLLLSGILVEDLTELKAIIAQNDFQLEELKEKQNWICARLIKMVRV
jgi:ribosomal protein L11 methyltransferase